MRFIKAVKIFDGSGFLPPGKVLAFSEDGRLHDVLHEAGVGSERVEVFDGILCPGFVNAHCHLELSHLRGRVSPGKGFSAFALELMQKRTAVPQQARMQAMHEAAAEMRENGVVAVGDISNSAESAEVKRNSQMFYHTFVELIALKPQSAQQAFEGGVSLLRSFRENQLQASLAAHAPYTASRELIRMIAGHDRENGMPFTIHNQESIEERLFFMGGKSTISDLYASLAIDISWFRPTHKSSLLSYIDLLAGTRSILVHNTFSEPEDIEQGHAAGVHWCFCPGANLYIEKAVPDFSLFRQTPSRICIGTDSLASNDSLDVLRELNHLATTGLFEPGELLAMVCLNGAVALGCDDRYGRLTPGTSPGLNLVDFDGTRFEFREKIF